MAISRQEKLNRLGSLIACSGTKWWLRKRLILRAKFLIKKGKDGDVYRDRLESLKLIQAFPEYIFKAMYRVNRATFTFILDKINAKLPRTEKSDEMARRSVKDGEGSTSKGNTYL